MSNKKMIDRKTILAAIKSEPLAYGSFVAGENEDNKCNVCAVGAVLRRVGFDNSEIESFGFKMFNEGSVADINYIEEYLSNRRYLHALSVKFEYQSRVTGNGKRTRNILTKFVKENFPKKIVLDPKL